MSTRVGSSQVVNNKLIRIKKRDKRVKRAEERKRQLKMRKRKFVFPEYLEYINQTVCKKRKKITS